MIKSLLESEEIKALIKANEFNMLSLFSEIFNENSYTRILSYLFNSEENHGLNQQFFRSWLKKIDNLDFKLPAVKNSTIKSSFNWQTHDGRFIDLVVQVIDRETGKVTHVLGLENKKFTKESESQLSDYQEDIIGTFDEDTDKVIIYMTPKGDKASSCSDDEDIDSECPCISVSYNSLVETCEEKFETNNCDILLLIKHLKNYIKHHIVYGASMRDSKRNIVNSISKNSEYKKAIEEIIKYYPTFKTIRNLVYEDILPELLDRYRYVRIAWIYPSRSNTPHEINFEINPKGKSIKELLGRKKISFYYMLHSSTPNPHIGDEVCIRLMAWCGDGYDYVKSSQAFAQKIKKADIFNEDLSTPRQWKPWECLYSGGTYNLQDMGEQDTESIVELIGDCVEETYKPLEDYIKSIK